MSKIGNIIKRSLNVIPLGITKFRRKQGGYKRIFNPRTAYRRQYDKRLSGYKLTLVQKCVLLLKNTTCFFKGSFEAVFPDKTPPDFSKTQEAEFIEKAWKCFNDPEKIYVLVFNNPDDEGTQHAAMVMGSTEGYSSNDSSIYASWTFSDAELSNLGPLITKRCVSSFAKECAYHGAPRVVELPALDVDKIKRTWMKLQKKRRIYQVLGFNCSTLVATLVKSGLEPKMKKLIKKFSPIGFWTPYDVINMTESLKGTLEMKHRSDKQS